MNNTDAKNIAIQAFEHTRTPGLELVASVLQRAVTNEQNRLAAEIAKVEGHCTDLENKTKQLESSLAAERKMTDKFVEWLVHTLISELDKSELAEIDAALLEYRKVRDEEGDA